MKNGWHLAYTAIIRRLIPAVLVFKCTIPAAGVKRPIWSEFACAVLSFSVKFFAKPQDHEHEKWSTTIMKNDRLSPAIERTMQPID